VITQENMSTKALKTLTTLALTLPGTQMAKAEAPISKPQADFRYTRFNEGRKRYEIDVYQAQLGLALGPAMDLMVKAGQEVMSGATSVFYAPAIYTTRTASPSTLLETRSGSSIQDKRSTGDITVRFFGDDYNVAVGVGISEEDDYESQTYHAQLKNEFNKSNTELTFGFSFSNDSIKPVPLASSPTSLRTLKRQARKGYQFQVALKQDLSTTTLVQGNLEFIGDRGFLDDPYKLVFIYGNPNRQEAAVLQPGRGSPFAVPVTLDGDHRPAYRGTLASGIRFVQHIKPLNSSIHLGYRFVKNTWGIRSHTINLDYYQQLGDSWEVIPTFRYYTQGAAYFYAMAFDALGNAPFPSKRIGSTGPASSDYRLAKFGSITGELKLHYKFMADQSGKFTLAFGLINRRNNFYWGNKPNPLNPTNDFKTYYSSVGLSFVF
jgi:hypothetical protein